MSEFHLSDFGGGVVLAGSADTRKVNEVARADSVDIALRGALVAASDVTDYANVTDQNGAPLSSVLGIVPMSGFNTGDVFVIGEGASNRSASSYLHGRVAGTGGGNVAYDNAFGPIPPVQVLAEGVYVTSFSFPGQFDVRFGAQPVAQISAFFVNIGAREGTAPRLAPGLYAIFAHPAGTAPTATPINFFDSLGTGPDGQLNVDTSVQGAQSKQLYFRGVGVYNNHAFGYGFDANDTVYGEGSNRVMFCNLGAPLTWGNDNTDDQTIDRVFTDSDAIVLGDAGELIRASLSYNGRFYFGTDRGLHFISGYGRDSFLTDGSTPIMKAYNVIGPHALIEGPDRLMYGMSDQGLWAFDGSGNPNPLFAKLRDINNRSNGYWDLLWHNPAAGLGVPGNTNRDLVWMASDYDRQQVLIGIPYCNGVGGAGLGNDTVIIRYHVTTGGFTRQVFRNTILTAAGYFRRSGLQPETRMLGTAGNAHKNVMRYGFAATPAAAPVLPNRLPALEFGPYAPFGPDGQGVIRRGYMTVSWDGAGALPLVFRIQTTVDQSAVDNFLLTIGVSVSGTPSVGDLWLDTSETDTGIGNGSLTSAIPSVGGYLLKTWTGGMWIQLSGQGTRGTRATIPLPLTRRMGTRLTFAVSSLAAAGRFSVEGMGWEPGAGAESA